MPVRLGGLSRHVHVVRRLCPAASSTAFVPDNEFADAVQAVHVRDDMDRILTLLAVQEKLGLAAEGPLPPAALAQAAIEVHSLRNCSADTQTTRRGGEKGGHKNIFCCLAPQICGYLEACMIQRALDVFLEIEGPLQHQQRVKMREEDHMSPYAGVKQRAGRGCGSC